MGGPGSSRWGYKNAERTAESFHIPAVDAINESGPPAPITENPRNSRGRDVDALHQKKEAEAAFGKNLAAIREGRYFDVKPKYETTMAEAIEKFHEWAKQKKSYKSNYAVHLTPILATFGKKRLLDITELEVEERNGGQRGWKYPPSGEGNHPRRTRAVCAPPSSTMN